MRHHAAPPSCTHTRLSRPCSPWPSAARGAGASSASAAGLPRRHILARRHIPARRPAGPPARRLVPAPRRFPARAAARLQAAPPRRRQENRAGQRAPPRRRQENRAGQRGQHGAAPFRLRRGPCRQAATLRGLRGPAAAGRPLRGPTARPGSSTRAYRRRAHIARPQDAHLPPPEAYYPGPPPPS